MKKAYIKAISYYLPEKVVTNNDLEAEFPEWSAEKVASKIGVSERHIAAPGETSGDMAVSAARNLFKEYSIEPRVIDFIMLCTQSPDYFLPTTACTIQERLGIPVKSGAIDFNLGCSGFVYGLALAKGLIISGVASNVLLLTSETYSKFIHPWDKSNRRIFGDAAAATLVSDSGFAEILEFALGTDGRGAERLTVQTGAMRHLSPKNDLTFDEAGNPLSSDNLFMDGTEIFNFTLEMVPELVKETLDQNHVKQDDVNLFVFHQANKYMLNFLRKKIRIPEERFYYFLDKVGNTVSSTIPVAISAAIREGSIRPADRMLIAGFGVGYSWAGNILQFSEK
jgi:3-oxoacyl-[acyl-carrier-protein] synthase-3